VTENRSVGGSIPPLGTIQLFEFFRKSQLVPSRAASLQTALQPLCNLSAFASPTSPIGGERRR